MAISTPLALGTDSRFGWHEIGVDVPLWPMDTGRHRVAADVAEMARLRQVVQAGRELAHSVNNLLSLPLGVLELLEAQAGVPADLQALVAAAREALASAATEAQDFQALARQASAFMDTPPN
jgi:hypothetical protein